MFFNADITLRTVETAIRILDNIDAIVGLAYLAYLSFIFETGSRDTWIDECSCQPYDIEENDDNG